MLLADLQKIRGIDDNALEVISCGLNRDFVKEHGRGGRGMAQLAGETLLPPRSIHVRAEDRLTATS